MNSKREEEKGYDTHKTTEKNNGKEIIAWITMESQSLKAVKATIKRTTMAGRRMANANSILVGNNDRESTKCLTVPQRVASNDNCGEPVEETYSRPYLQRRQRGNLH